MLKNFLKLFIFSIKEIKAQLKIQSFLVFNLAFGIFGFLLLQIFQQSLYQLVMLVLLVMLLLH